VLAAAVPGLELSPEPGPGEPPLDHGDDSFDFACAITPWSRFSESSADAWLSELRRVVRPGGRLVLTSHTDFLTPDWLLAHSSPEWAVLLYRPGRILGGQDLYVLEPR
jgi:SAM-dependent methyltransferase